MKSGQTPVLGSSTPVLNMEVKQGKNVIWVFLKILISNESESSRRDVIFI